MNNDLISRSALLDGYDVRKVTEYDESGCGMTYKAVPVEAIEQAPTVDAVEVVRCRDCIAFGKSPYGHPGLGWCRIYGHHFNPDYYCASGRRKGDASGDE